MDSFVVTHYFLTHREIFNPFLLRRNQNVDLHKQGLKTVDCYNSCISFPLIGML